MKHVLSIAGFDPTGGAGILADARAIHAQGAHAASVVTAITSQTATGVSEVFPHTPHHVRAQLETLLGDATFDAVKIGMLATNELVVCVVDVLAAHDVRNIVVDPVLCSSNGTLLLEEDAIDSLIERLFPMATVVTPNLDEAARLSEVLIKSVDDMVAAGHRLIDLGATNAVVTGGHADFALATDVFVSANHTEILTPDKKPAPKNVHGTGCVFASTIAARLALGDTPLDATRAAKTVVTDAIWNAVPLGSGFVPGI